MMIAEFSRWEYRNIALAAVTQCASQVHQLASQGSATPKQLMTCLNPVYELDPDSVAIVYPDVHRFNDGIDILQRSFDSAGLRENAEVVRYLLGMLVLQQHLRRRADMQSTLRDRLRQLSVDALREPSGHDDADRLAIQTDCSALARLYQDTISKLSFRIHVAGNPEYLRDHAVADQIRALLLAGIRSGVLWHQLGGRRWHLFFYKKRIKDTLSGIRRKLITAD